MYESINNELKKIIDINSNNIVNYIIDDIVSAKEYIINDIKYYIDNKQNVYLKVDKDNYKCIGLFKNNIIYKL